MSDPVLTPTGASVVAALRGDAQLAGDGSSRVSYAAGTTTVAAPLQVALTAAAVRPPGAEFTQARAVLQAVSVPGVTVLADAGSTTVAAGAASVNVIGAADPSDDTVTVTAKTIHLDADVRVAGALDTASAATLSLLDTTLRMGAIDVDGDEVADMEDALRDGAGLVVPGAPKDLPSGKDAALFEHSLTWAKRLGDFDTAEATMAPHQRPLWEARGGGVSIVSPDAGGRPARFLFSPTFNASEARMDAYYKVGDEATLVATFATPPFQSPPDWNGAAEALAPGTKGAAYTHTFAAAGADTYALAGGTLPAGVTLSARGVLSGTASESGAFTFAVAALTSDGASSERGFTLLLEGPPGGSVPPGTRPTFFISMTSMGGAEYFIDLVHERGGVRTPFYMKQPYSGWRFFPDGAVNQSGGGGRFNINHTVVGNKLVLDVSGTPRPSGPGSVDLPFTWQDGDTFSSFDMNVKEDSGQVMTLLSKSTNLI